MTHSFSEPLSYDSHESTGHPESVVAHLSENNKTPTPSTIDIPENKLAIVGLIIPFSVAGVLIRIGLQRLENYSGAPVFGLIYAQWIGCFIMGITVYNKVTLLQWYLPLQVALSSGLCGSITTFSSWQLDIFKAFSNYSDADHGRGDNVLAAISQLLVTLGMSFTGFIVGQHAGRCIEWIVQCKHSSQGKDQHELKVVPHHFETEYLQLHDYGVIIFGLLLWVGVVLAAIFTQQQQEIALACVFAPVGSLLRWRLSFLNVYMENHFPVGTFIANVFGTAVLAVLALVQSGPMLSPMACTLTQALADGFCGCLTTISTFIVEIKTLSFSNTYMYGTISVVVSQCLLFVILGSYVWTQGIHPVCN
ncbi:CrcB-like protein-domain-containing protein [Spinellus fusiger]|nr:CrcB-like protein-domain-containing protein [Spinellus fusiger]